MEDDYFLVFIEEEVEWIDVDESNGIGFGRADTKAKVECALLDFEGMCNEFPTKEENKQHLLETIYWQYLQECAPGYEPDVCESCEAEAEEEGVGYEHNATWNFQGCTWECDNCRQPL